MLRMPTSVYPEARSTDRGHGRTSRHVDRPHGDFGHAAAGKRRQHGPRRRARSVGDNPRILRAIGPFRGQCRHAGGRERPRPHRHDVGRLAQRSSLLIEQQTPSVFPIISLDLSGGSSPAMLKDYATYTLRPLLKRLPDVAYVTIIGGDEREIVVEPAPDALARPAFRSTTSASSFRPATPSKRPEKSIGSSGIGNPRQYEFEYA